MASEPSGSNRRRSYRFPSAEPSFGDLLIAGRVCPVQITDESAGGLGVCCLGPVEVSQGATAELRTAAPSFEVRVVRVCVDDATGSVSLGLERICELAPPGGRGEDALRRLLAYLKPSFDIAQAVPLVLGLLAAVIIVAMPVLLRNWRGEGTLEELLPPGLTTTSSEPASGVPALPIRPSPSQTPTSSPPAVAAAASTHPAPAPSARPFCIADLRGLLVPETARRLALSPEQEEMIRAIVRSLSEKQSARRPDSTLIGPLAEELREVLTPRQLSQLPELARMAQQRSSQPTAAADANALTGEHPGGAAKSGEADPVRPDGK
ncbi:MAG: hypothetical protein ABFC96_08660 [Thermoguttaceae bacterium]